MVLRMRLARFGTKRKPVYNIVVAQARSARDSLPLEVIGTYNPKPVAPRDTATTSATTKSGPSGFKNVSLDTVRTKYWIGVGAQPTETVWRILGLAGILPPSRKVVGIREAIAAASASSSSSSGAGPSKSKAPSASE